MSDTLSPTQTFVMTGATRGLGKSAAMELLRSSPDLHLAVVWRSDPGAALDELTRESGNPNASATIADLSSIASARAAAAALRAELESGKLPRLAAIVSNAGVQMTSATMRTVDGIETTFAVNVLANCILVRELRTVRAARPDRTHAQRNPLRRLPPHLRPGSRAALGGARPPRNRNRVWSCGLRGRWTRCVLDQLAGGDLSRPRPGPPPSGGSRGVLV
jgi:NAD(P)-dependent dehydrogenase (short-subunit alcohol dehydrogenase family)